MRLRGSKGQTTPGKSSGTFPTWLHTTDHRQPDTLNSATHSPSLLPRPSGQVCHRAVDQTLLPPACSGRSTATWRGLPALLALLLAPSLQAKLRSHCLQRHSCPGQPFSRTSAMPCMSAPVLWRSAGRPPLLLWPSHRRSTHARRCRNRVTACLAIDTSPRSSRPRASAQHGPSRPQRCARSPPLSTTALRGPRGLCG